MDGVAMDDSYASLEASVDSKWFETLLALHNDLDSKFHINLFEPIFMIGKDLNLLDDIVYMILS
jgi:hypothetical protein